MNVLSALKLVPVQYRTNINKPTITRRPRKIGRLRKLGLVPWSMKYSSYYKHLGNSNSYSSASKITALNTPQDPSLEELNAPS